ncbi:hypothetical protein V500_08857 [Pseudogymnoascus sp. VKM F-4518 (FW-2643)]|nr:hypothetical protein V500_08857 [Pseudogymnoascus sp. VKM F-4518 (FW-2643)]
MSRSTGVPNEARDGILITRAPAPEHSTEQHQAAPTFPPPRATGAAERQPGRSRESGAHDEFMAASKVLGEETVAGGGQEGSQAGDT